MSDLTFKDRWSVIPLVDHPFIAGDCYSIYDEFAEKEIAFFMDLQSAVNMVEILCYTRDISNVRGVSANDLISEE